MIVAALLGLCLGSYLSVLVARWPRWSGIATGRSQCPTCRATLAWYDLVPLASWVMLRGRCRSCRVAISGWYPGMEACMAATLGASALHWQGFGISTVLTIAVLFCLVALVVFDIRHLVLPDVLVAGLAVAGGISQAMAGWSYALSAASVGIVLAAFLAALYVVSHGRWLGLGDVKLALAMGMVFGYPDAVSIVFIAIWLGTLAGLILMASHRATLKTALPFGAFWSGTAIVALLWPSSIAWLSNILVIP